MGRGCQITALAVVFGLGTLGCEAPGAPAPAAAPQLLTVALELSSEAPPSLATLHLSVAPAEGAAIERVHDLIDGDSALFAVWVTPGEWLVVIEGRDRYGATLFCGMAPAIVLRGQLATVHVILRATETCEPVELACSDGLDDDDDGDTDCEDGDCDGAPCDDGDACTLGDVCGGGGCLAGSEPVACADGDPCTADACAPALGCQYAPLSGTPCPGGTCDAGVCVPDPPPPCAEYELCFAVCQNDGGSPEACQLICDQSQPEGSAPFWAYAQCLGLLCVEAPDPPACAAAACADPAQCQALCAACGHGECEPQCDGKVCGSDGCGGQCPPGCADDRTCDASGQCVCPVDCTPEAKGCDGDQPTICQIGAGGCPEWVASGDSCGGGDVCADGVCVCAGECTPGETLCWEEGYYACTGATGCAAWEAQETCAYGCVEGSGCCVPDCDGKACGDSGCAIGSCGECAGSEVCGADGQCCGADCLDNACGADGCGGTCGSCGVGGECVDDQCTGTCMDVFACGIACTDGDQACASACLNTGSPSGKAVATQLFLCAFGACGGFNRACFEASILEGAACYARFADCEVQCAADCDGRICGDDGCGRTCGACPAGERCDGAGACVTCSEADKGCDGEACGPDLCGGSCGSCGPTEFCVGPQPQQGPSWAPGVVGTCEPCVCGECGLSGCGYACGTCAPGFVCTDSACVACTPDCAGKACGADGCGGSCGSCQPWEWCAPGPGGGTYCEGGA